ncbi:MAG: hypothetical protein H7124_13030 [Phycisphaerales bacterium]|nr:hypothetical protein [Hyphomonadaceae bacterium]
MAVPAGKVPIFESAGQAVGFLRQQWRFVLTVAAVTAFAQAAAFLLLGVTLPFLVLIFFFAACAHAAFLARALDGPAPFDWKALLRNGARVFTAVGAIAFFMAIVGFMVFYIAMGVLIAPYQNEVKAAGEDQAALTQIMTQAVESQPGTLMWALLIGGLLLLLLTSRFYLAAPASVDCKRIVVFDSWRWSKGNMLRIVAARLAVLGPALALVFALQSLASLLLGAPAADPMQTAALIQANPIRFAAFYFLAGFIQLAFYGALEAGLAAFLYRGLRPAVPQPPAA